MQNIATGMLLTFLNFNLDIGASRIGLIPTFVGYIFMAVGLWELKEYSGHFIRVRPLVKIMAVYTGILYVIDFLGLSTADETSGFFWLGLLLGLISLIVSLFISHRIIMGIKDIEEAQVRDLNSGPLYSAWRLQAIFLCLSYLFIAIIPVVALICIIIGFFVAISYIVMFYKTKNLFYEEAY